MSKRALKAYLQELTKEQLEDQLLDLYHRFAEVKTYYDFSFNPKEDKLIADAKFKISKEYFPLGKRKPKARRSVAQKLIKHFAKIGMDATLLADLMLYNIEVALKFNQAKPQKSEAFFKSIANSFVEVVDYIWLNGLERDLHHRLENTVNESVRQEWYNSEAFERKLNERPS